MQRSCNKRSLPVVFRDYENPSQTLSRLCEDQDSSKEAADRYSALTRSYLVNIKQSLLFDLIRTNGEVVTEEKAAQWLLRSCS